MENELLELLRGDVSAGQRGIDMGLDRFVDGGGGDAGQRDPAPVASGQPGPTPQLTEHGVNDTIGRERADRRRSLVDHYLLVLRPADLRAPFGSFAATSRAGPRPSSPPVVVSVV